MVYSDYFQIHIHYRFTAERPVSTSKAQLPAARLIVVADIEFVKPCLFKGRIEAESWSGLKKYYEVVDKEVQLEKTSNEDEEDEELIEVEDDNGEDGEKGEAGVEDVTEVHANTSRFIRRRRKAHYGDAQTTNHSSSNGQPPGGGFVISTELGLLVLFMTLVTLALTTMVMFKMNSAISLLDERMAQLEETSERNYRLMAKILSESIHRMKGERT